MRLSMTLRMILLGSFFALTMACEPVSEDKESTTSEDEAGDTADTADTDNTDKTGDDAGAADGTDAGGGADGGSDGASDSDGGDDDSSDGGEPEPQFIEVLGSLRLDGGVLGTTDELTPGQPIENGVVFLKDFPDVSTTSDAQGAFTLKVPLPAAASLQGTNEYNVVMWYTTQTNEVKFGVQEDIDAAPNTPVDLGDVDLAYTTQARFNLYDDVGQTNPIANTVNICTISFPGYENRIVVEEEAGLLAADYLPPATYTVVINCTGFEEKTHTFPFPDTPAAASGSWEGVDITLDPES